MLPELCFTVLAELGGSGYDRGRHWGLRRFEDRAAEEHTAP